MLVMVWLRLGIYSEGWVSGTIMMKAFVGAGHVFEVLFDASPVRDVLIICGYMEEGNIEIVEPLFHKMLEGLEFRECDDRHVY